MQFKQLVSFLCLCVMVVMSGCAGYFRHHNLGDDTIQEYIKPAEFLAGGFVDRVKCPTSKRKLHPDKEKYPNVMVCPGTVGNDAYLAWQVNVDEKKESYGDKALSAAMHGMSFLPAAAVIGVSMPSTNVNQSGPTINETFSTKYVGK